MLTQKKYRILLWAVVLLAILNFSIIGSILWHVNEPDQLSAARMVKPMRNQERSDSPRRMRFFMHNELNLSDKQIVQFDQRHDDFRKQAKQIANYMTVLRDEMLIELAKENPNEEELLKISESIGNAHRDLKILTYQFFLDLKEICNPEQSFKLEKVFRTIMQADPPENMRRGGMSRRGGRNMNRQVN